jgi:GLPGLI family protein
MKTIITLALLLLTGSLFAQHAKFITSGTIEFEKSINVYALAKREMGKRTDALSIQRLEAYEKSTPQFTKLHGTLTFDNNKTLYTPATETYERIWGNDNPAGKQFNLVYNDLATGLTTNQKNIYEELFLLKDSIRKIKWKITDETREIAGFTCRRANALIMDSVYVVAFYTNEIHVSGGPESFTGLPGMILGVALPYDSFTWFATKVTEAVIPPNVIVPAKKGKVINNKQLAEILKDFMKSWGTNIAPFETKVYSL